MALEINPDTGTIQNEGGGGITLDPGATDLVTVSNGMLFPDGTVTEPGIRFDDDTNTGMYSPVNDTIGMAGHGADIMRLHGVTSAVNYLDVTPAITANNVLLKVDGADTNIGLEIDSKGTGPIKLHSLTYPAADGTANQVIETDGAGNLSFVTVASAAQGTLADSATQPADNISTLTNDSGYITSAPVTSVAGKTGVVTLVKADITDFVETDYATGAEGDLATSALQDLTGTSIKTLSDVFTTMTPADGEVLTYDTTNGWQSEAAGGGGGATELSGLTDVSNTLIQLGTPHRYWRINITANGGDVNFVGISELTFRKGFGGSTTTTGGTASASVEGNPASNAFDLDYGTFWHAGSGNTTGWIKYDYGVGNGFNVVEYSVAPWQTTARSPKSWTLQHSDDDSVWTTVHTVTNTPDWTAQEERTYTVDANGMIYNSVMVYDGDAEEWVTTDPASLINYNWVYANAGMDFTTASAGTGAGSIAIGDSASTNSAGKAIAIGDNANGTGADGVSIGTNTNVTGANGVSIGYGADATNTSATSVGYNSTASGNSSLSLGPSGISAGTAAVGIGNLNRASGGWSIAIGVSANAGLDEAVAIGRNVATTTASQIRIGSSNTDTFDYLAGKFSLTNSTNAQFVVPPYATGSRPASPTTGSHVFDTTLGKPIWYNGTNWVDATGTTV